MKSFWKSKTLWFNAITGVLAMVEQAQPLLEQFLSEGTANEVLLTVNVLGNMILRFATKTGIVAKGE